jgi:hypothetical protein
MCRTKSIRNLTASIKSFRSGLFFFEPLLDRLPSRDSTVAAGAAWVESTHGARMALPPVIADAMALRTTTGFSKKRRARLPGTMNHHTMAELQKKDTGARRPRVTRFAFTRTSGRHRPISGRGLTFTTKTGMFPKSVEHGRQDRHPRLASA